MADDIKLEERQRRRIRISRDWVLAAALAVACALIVAGIAQWSTGAALIAAGILLAIYAAAITVLGLEDEPEELAPADDELEDGTE